MYTQFEPSKYYILKTESMDCKRKENYAERKVLTLTKTSLTIRKRNRLGKQGFFKELISIFCNESDVKTFVYFLHFLRSWYKSDRQTDGLAALCQLTLAGYTKAPLKMLIYIYLEYLNLNRHVYKGNFVKLYLYPKYNHVAENVSPPQKKHVTENVCQNNHVAENISPKITV